MVARNIALAELDRLARPPRARQHRRRRRARSAGRRRAACPSPPRSRRTTSRLTHEAVLLGAGGESPGGARLRHQRQGQPAAAHAGGRRRLRGRPARRHDRLHRHRPRAARHRGQALRVRPRRVRHQRPGDGVRALPDAGARRRSTCATLIERLTVAPVRALGLDRRIEGLGTLSAGAPGDVALIDPRRSGRWSRSASPARGRTRRWPADPAGRVVATVYGGRWCGRHERQSSGADRGWHTGVVGVASLGFNSGIAERSQPRLTRRRHARAAAPGALHRAQLDAAPEAMVG